MSDATSNQIVQTLANMRQEVSTDGISEAADDMWQHALTLYRRKMGIVPVPTGDANLPMLLRRQAE